MQKKLTALPFVLITLLLSEAVPGSAASANLDKQVQAITRSAILIDTHNDIPSFTVDGDDIARPAPSRHTDLPRLREGGVGAIFFSVFVAPDYVEGNHSAHRALELIDSVRQDVVAQHPKDFVLATTADDVVRAHKHHQIAALMGLEGGHGIEDSPRLLRDFYALGIRYMTLTHTNTNTWADSSGDLDDQKVQRHGGLTPLGKEIVQQMNRLGMIVDISHVSDETFRDALATSKAPLLASHSSCRALTNVPRNMTDDMIKAMAAKGGVIQINFNCGFLSQASADAEKKSPFMDRFKQITKEYRNDPQKRREETEKLLAEAKKTQVRATLHDVVAHIDHVRQIAGIDAIGIGSDFDGVDCTPEGLDDVSKFPNLTRALLEKGYSAGDIKKIYGENTLRLMRQVEKVATTSSKTLIP
ncbi:MAG TPA: dipeptidase [Bryobacteraceae bacterium]|jgi:membrane dipeptidase|nr:dipeptidase [Bryobacteraceae bacterium]